MDQANDYFPQVLMDELISARQPYPVAYDTLYRRERMLRYAYWLKHRERPSFNFIGTWIPDQMRTELAMWNSMHKRNLDDADVIETVTKQLEQRFGSTLSGAQALVTAPDLAHHHLPIWNVAADCLVPQKLGDFLIAGTSSYQEPSDGLSYTYRHTLNDAPLTLYIYDLGLAPIKPGLSDPRFAKHFADCMGGVEHYLCLNRRGIAIVTRSASRSAWYAVRCRNSVRERKLGRNSSDGQRGRSLSVTGFRDMFLKGRLTGPIDFFVTDTGQASVSELNLDLADFVFGFGDPKPKNER